MWLEPPTITRSSSSWRETPPSRKTRWMGAVIRRKRAPHLRISHSLERVRAAEMLPSSTDMITISWRVRAILQVSPWRISSSFCRGVRPSKSSPQSSQKPLAMARSKSEPPRRLSPLTAVTLTTFPNRSTRETSRVPPPRSKTRQTLSASPWPMRPATAAAEGSFTSRSAFSPARAAARFVAERWASAK